MKNIKIKTATKTFVVPEDDFLRAIYNWCSTHFADTKREIILQADGEKKFVVVPFNINHYNTPTDELD